MARITMADGTDYTVNEDHKALAKKINTGSRLLGVCPVGEPESTVVFLNVDQIQSIGP